MHTTRPTHLAPMRLQGCGMRLRLLALPLVVGLAACGGDGGGLDEQAFATEAESICASTLDAVLEVDLPTEPDAVAAWSEQIDPLLRDAADDLGELDVDDDTGAARDDLVGGIETYLAGDQVDSDVVDAYPGCFGQSAVEVTRGGTPQSGIVKWFNASKAFGYITPDGGGPDLYVHSSEIMGLSGTLREGQRVGYQVTEGPKGLQAANVSAM
jgi:CspA family cold shock protein